MKIFQFCFLHSTLKSCRLLPITVLFLKKIKIFHLVIGTYSFEFPPQNEIIKIFKKTWLQVRGDKFKEWNAKNRIKYLHLSMRYVQNTKRQNSHRIAWRGRKGISLTEGLNKKFPPQALVHYNTYMPLYTEFL